MLWRPGNVHGAHGWREVLEPVAVQYRDRKLRRCHSGEVTTRNDGIKAFSI